LGAYSTDRCDLAAASVVYLVYFFLKYITRSDLSDLELVLTILDQNSVITSPEQGELGH
jgi:hypothetical protein